MKYVVTGAEGFLGYHARARLAVDPSADVVTVGRHDWASGGLASALAGADVVLHLAGINRAGDPEAAEPELHEGNVGLARELVEALEALTALEPLEAPEASEASEASKASGVDEVGQDAKSARRVPIVVYAGSTYADAEHPGTDSPYGRGKREAGAFLRDWAERRGTRATEVRFPGLFGEHGRPDYNSFVATFAHRIARGEEPQVSGDRELPLLPVGDAVTALLDAAARQDPGWRLVHPQARSVGIGEVAGRLQAMHDTYAVTGDFPDLSDSFDVALFNTLRAAMWPDAYPIRPTPRSDQRGTLVETVRVHGGGGQGFVSTTLPGHRRGDHVHFAKIERFQVISGTGLIRLRRMLTDDVLEFTVTGDEPAVIDMPTLWTHSIENVGDEPLVTFFWSNELFDPQRPDTYPMPVLDGPDRPTPSAPSTPEGSAAQEAR